MQPCTRLIKENIVKDFIILSPDIYIHVFFFSASPGFFRSLFWVSSGFSVMPSPFPCGLSFSGFYSQKTMPFHPLIAGVMVAVGG
jgi:hypothetical protein